MPHRRVIDQLVKVAEIRQRELGDLSLQEWQTLMFIAQEDPTPVRPRALQARWLISQATVSRCVRTLSGKLGVVQVSPDPTNLRATLLTLTPKGREIMRRIYRIFLNNNNNAGYVP